MIRIQESVLAAAEKRALVWLAARVPRSINSDHLTALALTAMIGAGASYWLASVTPVGLMLATVLLAVNWFGDSLDGTVARVRQHQRPRYGYYVDHVVDAVGAAALLGGLALSGYMRPAIALVLLLAYYLLSLEVYLAAHSLGRFQMSFFRMGPTELRLLLAAGNIVLLVHPTASIMGGVYSLFDVGGAVGAVGLVVTFACSAIGNTRQLYREEPLPGRRPARGETA
jgi:phosphatidylglycerophosphate synthase